MINPVTNGTQVQPADATEGQRTAKQPESQQSAANADSVQLSNAAQATLAALKEAVETPAQTAKEAAHGDLQAQRLLAREAAKHRQ